MKKPVITLLLLAVLLLSSLPASADYNTLANGDIGQDVVNLQVALNQLGYQTGGIDGKYGTSTENAIRKFQSRNGLKVDGKAGNATQTLIYEKVAASVQSSSASSSSSGATSTLYFGGDYSTLSFGANGSRVLLLQKALKELGYLTGTADGKFGTATEDAIKAFQKAQKLTVDGKAGKTTLRRIETLLTNGATPVPATPTPTPSKSSSSTVNGYTVPARTLRRGYSGEDVKSVQKRLKELGYFTGSVDGKYGTGTIQAVKAFQRANGLTPDGLAGAGTCNLLFSSSAVKASAAATAAPTKTPVPSTTDTLEYGDKGTAVTQMQQALKNLGYTVNVTGTYDSVTKKAIKDFQSNNGLASDGVAGPRTLKKLYSSGAVPAGSAGAKATPTPTPTPAPAAASSGSSSSAGTAGSSTAVGTAVGTVRLLHWFNDIKPSLSTGSTLVIYERSSGLSWSLKVISRGNHADCEPLTAADTAAMKQAFGGKNTWTQKGVYVKLPNGTWTVGSTHDMPHLTGGIKDNDFDGHLCVHFLRDMSECKKNDPNYGVSNQNTIRTLWKNLTGETIS